MEDRPRDQQRTILISVLLSALIVAAFLPVLGNGFLRFDDGEYVVDNPHVARGVSWENVAWAFTAYHSGNWHPLTWLSHMLDAQLFGLRPGWHHLTSLLLHLANSLLLFLLLKKLTGAVWRSALVAALFGLHPLHVESVAWVAERKDVLSTLFFILTLWAYANYAQGGSERAEAAGGLQLLSPDRRREAKKEHSRLCYGMAVALFALGLMSKPMLVTVPFVLLLMDYWPLERFSPERPGSSRVRAGRLLLEKVPFLVLAACSCVVTVLAQEHSHAVNRTKPWTTHVATALQSYVDYLGKMIWPRDLSIFYPYPAAQSAASTIAAATALAAVTLGAFWWVKRRRWFAVGWSWYLGMLVPVVGIVQVGSQAMADRYTYIPSIGVFVCVAWAAAELAAKARAARIAVAALCCAGVLACGAVTNNQARYWRSNQAVFEHALAVVDSAVTHCQLGIDYGSRGDVERAKKHFEAALALEPALADAYFGLGVTAQLAGDPGEAERRYRQALQLAPWHQLAHSRLADTLWAMGRRPEALEECAQALRVNPFDAETRINLGGMLWRVGQREEALAQYLEAVRLNPAHPVARFNLGFALSEAGQLPEATSELARAVQLNPRYTEALIELGRVLAAQGRVKEAEESFYAALRVAPTNASIQLNLANTLLVRGRTNEAVASFAEARRLDPGMAARLVDAGRTLAGQGQFEAALGRFTTALYLQPDSPEAHEGMGVALARLGKTEEAVSHLRQALQRKPDWPEALNALAWVLATNPDEKARDGPEAVRLAEKACALSDKEAHFWGTLDAAYAASGRFEEAITTAEKARGLAVAAGDTNFVQTTEARLALYRKGQAYHR